MGTGRPLRVDTAVVATLAVWLWAVGTAWALDCRSTRETSAAPTGPEITTFVLDCSLPLPARAIWRALADFPRLAEEGTRPTGIEYARVLNSEEAKREVATRLKDVAGKPDVVTRLLELPPDPSLLYEEYYHVNLFFVWGVRRFTADTTRSADGTYGLTFQQVDGLSSEAVFQGSFALTGEGKGSHLVYTLILSTHSKLAGEGLLDLLQRAVVGGMYLDGYQTYMKERVAEIVREAQRLEGADTSRGG